MDRCHYYLSNGLWKIARLYFDSQKKEQNDYFWGIAVLPNYNSFGSHIITTPWHQSWAAMDILETAQEKWDGKDLKNEGLCSSQISILRKEVNFQYILRNYLCQPFVQHLLTTYSRIQTHLLVTFNEIETKSFAEKLTSLLKILLIESPSNAHSLVQEMFKHGIFFMNCLEAMLNDVSSDTILCSLLVYGLCRFETIESHLPFLTDLFQSDFRYQLCLLLLASDNISFLQLMTENDKKILKEDTLSRLNNFLERGLEPAKIFSSMITMERHFLFEILDLIKLHMDAFQQSNYYNIPSFIWPLVLLQCWSDDSVSVNVFPLLIDKCKESCKDRIILQIAFILEWYINFSEWYEKHSMPDGLGVDKKSDLLEKAKEYSVLYLINNSTDLSETDWNQILELLKQGKSRTNIKKSWDIILFDGYQILIQVFHVIVASMEIYNLAKAQKTKLSEISSLNEIFSSLYCDEVTMKLELIKRMIKKMYPLNFRLEILENIFSCLFMQFEDVKKLGFLAKIRENIAKNLQMKFKSLEKRGSKLGKSFCPNQSQHSCKGEEDDIPKKRTRGFVCKKFIVRDLIYLVKECLVKLEENFRSQSDGMASNVPCSIAPDQMENRLDRLSESVIEATWRLQLVTDPDFISQIGVMHHPCGQDPLHNFDHEWLFLSHESEKAATFKSRKKVAEKPNDTGSESHSSDANSGAETQAVKYKISSRGIMNQILASDSSLVVQCLSQGDVLNANHIIHTLSAEENNQMLTGEVRYTEAINDLKKKIQNVSLESPLRKFSTEEGIPKSYSLQSIQIVANQGVASTAITNHIERFLTATTLPSIQGASKVSVGSMLQCIENSQAIVTIDLALTSDMTFQDFKSVLNIASKYCPELSTRIQSPISPRAAFSKPLGYIIFSQNIIALLQEVNKSQNPESGSEISLNQFLRSHQYPFSLKSLKDSLNFWKQLNSAVAEFEKFDSENTALVSNREVSVSKYQKNIKEMQKAFDSVKKLVENCSDFMDLGKFDTLSGEMSKPVNYSDLLSRYLTDLASFIVENIPSKFDIFEPVSFRGLLEQSAVDIVDRLIFTYNVEPSVLEKKAQQLGFNLSASLVAGCCPKLPQNNIINESGKCPPVDRIVLNELVLDYKSTEQLDPSEVVESIFLELLIAFQNYSRNKIVDTDTVDGLKYILTETDILELRNDYKIQGILEKTLQLNFVTFETLKNRELLSFFTNLLNLMMCHCYLTNKLDSTDGVYSNYFPNRDAGFMFLGYNVGELGFVSMYDVKCQIIGTGIRPFFSAGANERWEGLNIASDPLMIFTICDFHSTSPRLQFYTENNISSQIEKAVNSYVENFVDFKNERLLIPDLIDWYLEHVLIKIECENQTLGETEKMKSLVEFLKTHVSDSIQLQLHEIETSGTVLEVYSAAPKLSLILEYDPKHVICEEKKTGSSTEKWKLRTLSDSILRHLSQSSRVLADIVQKIHEAKEPAQTEVARDVLTEEKLKYLDLLLSAPWLNHISPLFDNNTVITALTKYPSESQLMRFLSVCIREREWLKCLGVLFALPDYYILSNLNLKRLKDVVLREITFSISQKCDEHPWYYSQHISDIHMRLETVKSCSKYWSGSVCISQLSSILCDYPDLRTDLVEEIRSLVRKIRVYNTICQNVPEYSGKIWFDVYSSAQTSPHIVLQNLIKASQLELCLQWMNLPGILSSIQQYIDSDFILLSFNLLSDNFELIDQLLNSLPPKSLSSICDSVVYKLKSIPLISHLVQLLIRINPLIKPKYEVIAFCVRILEDLSSEEQSELVHLIAHPLVIIEQLLMNMRLDALENVLRKVREETDSKLINQTEVNKLIASYASKAVEFDFIKTVKYSDVRQSFLLEARSQVQEFIVPAEVPDKSDWIPDSQVSLCMCCLLVSFSMFNRRHHCRRCGRVVCSTCSPHQLKVPGYRGVAVRVCVTCYNYHTTSEGDPIKKLSWKTLGTHAHENMLIIKKTPSSMENFGGSNFIQEVRYWKLTSDPSRNATIRDEFTYEYIPNVSLCLAIFNLLPDATYSSVLLDESEKMLKMLQMNGIAGNPEVDCGVVIQIIRSLIVGAKVKYGQASLTTGVDCCDRLLSHVDLLHLLIKNHCSRLIPSEPINTYTLRYLRDKLVEEELWELAIEVSTKCGLDRTGVWAAWGKVCLTAGSWEEARIKFSYCLDSTPKPARNPPLVDEICRILESASCFVGYKQVSKTPDKNDAAQEISQVLSNLKWLAQGKPLSFLAVSPKNSMPYNEQMYYLSTYGSHQGLISFFLKYDEWRSALEYLIDQQLDPDTFVESVLIPSFKNDQQTRLKTEMLSIDPSLEIFKKYLCHTCVYLQKADQLHFLYEIQLLMQDFIRAAATCIRLYERYAINYSELVIRNPHLQRALRHLEEEMTALSKKTKRLDCIMRLEVKEVNKHMNTIWRQLEVAKFLGDCEAEGKSIRSMFPECVSKTNEVITLFDGNAERIVLAYIIIIAGKKISEGFGISYRIIQDYQLDPKEIYLIAGKRLAKAQRLNDVEALIDCIKTSGADVSPSAIDDILGTCLPLMANSSEITEVYDKLIKQITNVELKISVLIDLKQLKSAYLLAVRYNRLKDVMRIMDVADQIGQTSIKKICMKKLGQSPEGSICSSIPSSEDL